MLVLLTLMVCNLSSAQKKHRCIAGLDLTSALASHDLGLFYGIATGNNFSVCAATSIRLPVTASEAEKTHKEDLMLEDSSARNISSDIIQAQISAQYWPKRQFDGMMISFGLGTGQSRNLYCPVEIGYMCPIGKAAKVAVGYNIDMIDTFKNQKMTGKSLCVRIACEF